MSHLKERFEKRYKSTGTDKHIHPHTRKLKFCFTGHPLFMSVRRLYIKIKATSILMWSIFETHIIYEYVSWPRNSQH
jgi:hypothetical protein